MMDDTARPPRPDAPPSPARLRRHLAHAALLRRPVPSGPVLGPRTGDGPRSSQAGASPAVDRTRRALAHRDAALEEARASEQRCRQDLTAVSVELGSVRQRLLQQDHAVASLQKHGHEVACELSNRLAELAGVRHGLDQARDRAAGLEAELDRLRDDALATAQALAGSRRDVQERDRVQDALRRQAETDLGELAAARAELSAAVLAAGEGDARQRHATEALRAAGDHNASLMARDAALGAELARTRQQRDQANDRAARLAQELDQAGRERAEADAGLRRELDEARRILAERTGELERERNAADASGRALQGGRLHTAFVDRFLRWHQAYVQPPGLAARRAIVLARRAGQKKRWRAAELRYRQVLNTHPRLQGVWMQYGHAVKEQGDLVAAYGAYGKALESGRRTADTLLHLAHSQRQLGLLADAEHSLRQALCLRPGMANLWDDLRAFGRSDAELVDIVLAEPRSAVSARPGRGLWFAILFRRAQKAMRGRRWPRAVTGFRAALAAAPDDARCWLLLGHALKENGDRAPALAAYLQALVLDPLNHEPIRHLEPLRPPFPAAPPPAADAPPPGPDAARVPVAFDLAPGVDLELQPDGSFVTTGRDPQFALRPRDGLPLPTGLVVLSIRARVADPVLRPLLHVWSGDALQSFVLPVMAGPQSVEWTVPLPERVTYLRLDPTEETGVRFAIDEVTARPRPPLAEGEELQDPQRNGMEYDAWVRLYDTLTPADTDAIRRRVAELPDGPLLSVVMPVFNPRPRYFRRALETVTAQLYGNWELCVADDASTDPEIRAILTEFAGADSRVRPVFRERNGHISAASNSALELVRGEFVVLMDHDDELPPHALYMVAEELNRHPGTDVIYTDEDKIDGDGRRHDPHFKTGWNLDLFYSQNIVAHLGVYRTSLVRKVGGFRIGFEGSQDYDFTLRILGLTTGERIRHIPFVLYHWRIFPGVRTFSSNNPDKSVATAHRALVDHFRDTKQDVDVLPIESFPGWWRIRRELPPVPPSVTLIIPTRDRLALLRGCVDGLLHGTDYPNLDLVIIDNDSVEPDTLAYFDGLKADRRVRVLRVVGPFNYSTLNNAAVREARGDYVGFVNNDIEVMRPDWLAEMMSQAVRPGVGAVGAKLLYANGNLQHAGVTLGVYGVAAHGHRHHPENAIGYFGRPQLQQELSAVTAAMLVMPRALFHEVGGFDAEHLAVGYNDVDLCLRIREAGFHVVYTPFAVLRHLESASRGQNVSPEQVERDRQERRYMIERWGAVLRHDPFYSDNLALTNEDFSLAFPPRVTRPWLDGPDAPLWQREQRRLDRTRPVGPDRVAAIAAATCLVVASAAAFATFARLAAELLDTDVVPGRVVVVDATDRGATLAGLPGARRLRARHPAMRIDLVRDDGQDFSVPRAANLAARDAGPSEFLLVVTEEVEPPPDWFEYMVRAFAGLDGDAVLSTRLLLPDGSLEEPVPLRDGRADQVVPVAEGYDALPRPRSAPAAGVGQAPVLRPDRAIAGGVFLGRRAILCPDGAPLFDERLYVAGREEDLSERLRPAGVRFASTAAAPMTLVRERPRDLMHFWRHVHDYAWLNRKLAGQASSGVTEFICPFHRGDVLIGLQVTAQAARMGRPIRMHVAAGLLSWAEDFAPAFPVEPVPVPVPPAEQTVLNLLRASLHVVQRPDASPEIALSHPMRGLDATDRNLVASMLQAVGLPPSTRLEPLRPRPEAEHVRTARRLLAPFGKDVVLVHRSGGWGLKTIPDPILREAVALLKRRGFAAVQIGGPGDEQVPYLDGAILDGFLPRQWAAIFAGARALLGVDSWSAHFASILDVPQISLYGSTAPRHVNSKSFFAERRAPSLVLGPVVDCSPCNSLTCLRAPVDFCMGYTFDRAAVGDFLDNLPRPDAPQPPE